MTEHINDRFDEPVDAEVVVEPIVDADDAKEIPAEEALATAKQNAKELGETLLEAASTAAYATVGLVGLASDRVKDYYEDQTRAYVAAHPDEESTSSAHKVMFRLREQLDEFVGDVGRLVRDLADRGRSGAETIADKAEDLADKAEDLAEKAADKAEDLAEKAADKAEDVADKVKDFTEGLVDRGEEGRS